MPLDATRPPYCSETRPRLGILISGRGSNLQAIIETTKTGALDATIAVVISNRADALGLTRAREAGIETLHIGPRAYADRDAYDQALADALRARGVSLVCLAGYMRLVGPRLLEAFPDRILNIHPSLLPSFRGLDAQKQALDFGVKVTGATVHVVTAALDDGPILVQAPVPVLPDDTVATLSARILVEEHRIYPLAIASVLSASPQPPAPSLQSPLDALVAAMPFGASEAIKVVELQPGETDLTRAIRRRFPDATIKTFGEKFDVASLDWWDSMFGADVVVAVHVMPKLTDAKKQYLYKAVADRVSARGGILVLDRVDGTSSQLFHQLMWMKHAGFSDVDCRWRQDGVAVFGGFTPRQAAASAPPLPAGN